MGSQSPQHGGGALRVGWGSGGGTYILERSVQALGATEA